MVQKNSFQALRELASRSVASIAPFVAEYLPLSEAIELLKLGAVDHLSRERQLSVATMATHLRMSLRWAYKYRTLLQSGPYQHLQRLPVRLEVLDYFRERYPQSATMTECLRALERQKTPIQPEELIDLLDAYCRFGYVTFGDGRYTWRNAPLFLNSAALVGRAQHAAGLMHLIGKNIRQFVETDEGALKHVHLTVSRAAYTQMMAELDETLKEIVKRTVERSIEEDPQGRYSDSVTLDAIIVIGSESYYPHATE